MPNATVIHDHMPVSPVVLPCGETCLVVPCADYDAFNALPKLVEFDGHNFGLSGWNSDSNTACYRTWAAKHVARVVVR